MAVEAFGREGFSPLDSQEAENNRWRQDRHFKRMPWGATSSNLIKYELVNRWGTVLRTQSPLIRVSSEESNSYHTHPFGLHFLVNVQQQCSGYLTESSSIIVFIPKRLWKFHICVLKVPRWVLSPAIFPRHLQELTRVLKETGKCLAHGIDRTLSWQVDFLHTRSWQRILSWFLGASGLDWPPNEEPLNLSNVSRCGTWGHEALQVFNVSSVFLL